MASPAKPPKSASVTAQSATGTCHGPTIGSRHDRPPTVRSPIVTRKRLLATVGWRSTSKATRLAGRPPSGRARAARARRRCTSRCIFGGLPSSTSIGMSIGGSLACGRRSTHRDELARRSRRRRPRTGSARARTSRRTAAATPARPPARSAPGFRCTRSPSAPGRSLRPAPCAGRSAHRARRRRRARGTRSRGRPRRRRGSPGSGSLRRAPSSG